MDSQKILLPSPNFVTKSSTPTPVSNFVASQVKCLASYKLLSSNDPVPGTEKRNFAFHHKRNRGIKREYNANNNNVSKNLWCEICDRKFNTVDEFYKHKREHKTCGINGCKFHGHPSIISKHIKEQHTSGLYDKIRKLNTPEEIAKWREERRKRYPTKANIELRQKAQEERMKRGEKLTDEKSRFGKRRDREPFRNKEHKSTIQQSNKQKSSEEKRKKIRNRFKKKNQSKLKKPKIENEVKKIESKPEIEKEENLSGNDGESNCKISRFKGTRDMVDCEKSDEKGKTENALTSLLGTYGSDESESEENIDDPNSPIVEIVKCNNISVHEKSISTDLKDSNINSNGKSSTLTEEEIACKKFKADSEISKLSDSEDDMPEEVPIIKDRIMLNNEQNLETTLKTPQVEVKPKLNKNEVKRKSGLNYSKLKYSKQNTLLEKLLAPNIRHERNILLQCVRFVVENNFFNIGNSNKNSV